VIEKKNFFLRNLWYYALPAGYLKPGTMVAKTFLGEPVLLARSRSGEVFALRDICPHRGIPLSCGRFDGKEVECCYHGWRFDTSGRCTAIPSLVEGQTFDFSRLRVMQYPVREVQGNIWIYMTEGNSAQTEPPEMEIPTIPYFKDKPYQMVEVMRFPCFLDHAVVGLMDPAHSPFVHRAWWWRSGRNFFEEVKQFVPSPYGFTMQRQKLENMGRAYWVIGGVPEVEISFRLPGIRIETITTSDHAICNLTAGTPISETETEVTFIGYWTVPWITAIAPLLQPLARAFLNQDREVVIKQQLGLQYNPTLMLIDDADVQARWYYQLKAEFARAAAEGRSFVNPVRERVLRWRA
jgi:phenylpropionate dioxygenase-like ring-hydroxylating dioxygenase large terminal subunit